MSDIEFTKGRSAASWWDLARLLSTLTIVPVLVIVIGLMVSDAPWPLLRIPAIVVFFGLLLAGGAVLRHSSTVAGAEARAGYTTLNDGGAALPLYDPARTSVIREAGAPQLSRAAYRDAVRALQQAAPPEAPAP